jgi:hypothetical protein
MLFGNRQSLGLEIAPLTPTWERRYIPEKSAWAALSIWANGQNICRHLKPGSEWLHETVNVPLAPVADWLCRSWSAVLFEERARVFPTDEMMHDAFARWAGSACAEGLTEDEWTDEREEWWSRHFLLAGAEGALLPNLALLRSDEHLVLEWRNQPDNEIGFASASGMERVRWVEAEDTLATFVRAIATWLRQDGLKTLYSWVGREDPLRAMPQSAGDVLELYTGRLEGDLYRITGAATKEQLLGRLGLAAESRDPAESPITQILRDLPLQIPTEIGEVLRRIDEMTRGRHTAELLVVREEVLDASRPSRTAEEAGQLAAVAVRTRAGLDSEPIDDVEALLVGLGISVTNREDAGHVSMVTGLRVDEGAATVLGDTPRMAAPWAKRFELARSLGHLLLDPVRSGAIGAGSSAFSVGTRRRRSGAFAAELLLPESALMVASQGTLDKAASPAVFRRLIQTYGVGATTAAFQLWNHGLLSSREIRDDLIDQFEGERMG